MRLTRAAAPDRYENQDGIMEWPLSFSLQPSAGNDQWKITLN